MILNFLNADVGIDQGGFPVGGASHVTLEDIMVGSKGGLMLGDNRVVQGGRTIPVKSKNSQDCMQVGEVLEIHPYGAVVSLNKATGEKAWIPGWEHSNIRQKKKKFLTTTQGKSGLHVFF